MDKTALYVAFVALFGVLWTALVAASNARKSRMHEKDLVELKAKLDEVSALRLAEAQSDLGARLKKLEFDRSEQVADDDRRRKADAATLARLLEVLNPGGAIEFLRQHDFGGSFQRSEVEPLGRFLVDSSRPDQEFLISDLEQIRRQLIEKGKSLSHLIGFRTHPGVGDSNSVLPPHLVNSERPEWVDSTAAELNQTATEFVEIYTELVRKARAATGA